MRADGSHVRRLTHTPLSERELSWSPDGTQLVFTRQGRGVNAEILTMRADGGGLRRLTRNGVFDVQPSWSPAGAIAFSSVRGDRQDVYVMRADGSRQHALTPLARVRPLARLATRPAAGLTIRLDCRKASS
jgi:TolB protein